MKALTLWPVWAHAIATLDKRVENRSWPPPKALMDKDFAIHAGALQREEPEFERWSRCLRTAEDCGWRLNDQGNLIRGSEDAGDWTITYPGSAIVCVARLVGVDQKWGARWDDDPDDGDGKPVFHWRLDNVRRLAAPVPCRGKQGLWDLPADVLNAVMAQLRPVSDG